MSGSKSVVVIVGAVVSDSVVCNDWVSARVESEQL